MGLENRFVRCWQDIFDRLLDWVDCKSDCACEKKLMLAMTSQILDWLKNINMNSLTSTSEIYKATLYAEVARGSCNLKNVATL